MRVMHKRSNMANYSTPVSRAGWRGQGFAHTGAAESSFGDEAPSVLLTPSFWIGGLLSLAVWTSIWTGIAWALDRI
jgi:hypothetical protein